MTTLELMVKEIYDEHHYLYTDSTITSAAEYIEEVNKNRDLTEEGVYTPRLWFKETKENDPSYFVTLDDIFNYALRYLACQRKKCLIENGFEPSFQDYVEHLESEEFGEKLGEWHELVSMDTLLNYILLNLTLGISI